MPSTARRRTSQSSIDRVLDLLNDLDDDQMELLLREAESTVAGNIPVSKGIDFFEQPGLSSPTRVQPQSPSSQPPRRKFLASLSPRKQTELRRRLSKRTTPQDNAAGHADQTENSKPMLPGYKRVSRPVFSLPPPAATADLVELLVAYLLDSSADLPISSASSTALSSPTTPRFPFSPYSQEECEELELDLLEPAPFRGPQTASIFGNPMREPAHNISGIFEVLDDATLFGPQH
ncbi:hypothetical protein GGS21DRAFT_14445 [Xylaria nigripes]|nr:hypothetical protein GGS21DRAFT_14445 [Xylaria nigripes]